MGNLFERRKKKRNLSKIKKAKESLRKKKRIKKKGFNCVCARYYGKPIQEKKD
jgi:hypothetical protein